MELTQQRILFIICVLLIQSIGSDARISRGKVIKLTLRIVAACRLRRRLLLRTLPLQELRLIAGVGRGAAAPPAGVLVE